MHNMARIIFILSLLAGLFICRPTQASQQISFIHIGLEEGLSQSTVFDITQDKEGNMWFATNDGLNKYDGYAFTIYQHNEQDSCTIASDMIRTLLIDSRNKLWIGTNEGLSRYDAGMDSFSNFFFPKSHKNLQIDNIVEIDSLHLLVNAQNELAIFDVQASAFTKANLPPALLTLSVTCLSRQGDNVYAGTNEGLYVYSIPQNTVSKLPARQLDGKHILTILQQSPTRLWVGTEGDGLFLINPQTHESKAYTPGSVHYLSSNYVRSLALDSQNRLWVGTFTSLNIYQEESDAFITYHSDPMKSGSLSQTSVRSIFMDSQGGMWLGTYFGGLNYYHPLKNRFKNIRFVPNHNSLNDNVVSCIVEDDQQNLWIGTNSGGVNHYDIRKESFSHYTVRNGLGSNDIKAIYIDKARKLVYIGTQAGGLSILNTAGGRIETFNSASASTAERSIYAILPADNGDLWLGTLQDLKRFNRQQKTFTSITRQKNGKPFKAERISTLFEDSKHRLWIGTEEGLNVYEQNQGELESHVLLPESHPLNKKFIYCIYEASNGMFWIGTRSGLYCFDENKKEIKQYTTADGLPNNVIFGIREDSFGKLWMSTDKGLSCFQPKTQKFRNFTSVDGLQSNQFTPYSYCRTSDGQMYFGGINGITTFYPEQLMDNPYIPPVVITELRLFNKPVRPGDDTAILNRHISKTRSITLGAGQSMFSLEFVVSNYISGEHNTFAYKLEGYDKEWYYSNSLRTVSYSNLPHGSYRFLVKAANSDGKWNETPTELEITILPVWYKTWWAFLLFLVAAIGIVVFFFRYFWIRKSMNAQLQMERIDKERQKEVNEMKLRFFINISHELRTPLTLILAPLQEMYDKVDDRWIRKQVEYVQRNANRLLHLVNQLMDYRRAELGVFELKVKSTDVHRIIEKDFLFYDKLAQRKKIQYDFHSEVEGKELLCDPNYLELIVNNLLSNAFKYTAEGQSITVTLKVEDGSLKLQVKDTGIGIPIDKQGRIFERFYQVENEHPGSGIGLSLVQRLVELHHGRIELDSSEGQGSTFSVYLPATADSYLPEELAGSAEEGSEEQIYSTNTQEMYIVDAEENNAEEDAESEKQKADTILLVEDNAEVRQYLSSELAKSFHILEARNGEEALEMVKENEVRLILTDVMMPVMDGINLCRSIKQNLRTCHIPVIFLSAKTDLKEQMEGLQVGADDYIPKPFSLALVTTKIRNILRTHYRAIEHYSSSLEIEPEKIALNPMDEDFLKKAVETVEKHMDDIEFTTDLFANEMFMSRSNLHLKMKAVTGESTNEFIRKIRFNKASKLLKEGRYTVAEISSMVGFNTPSYFATSFKKYFGCLPTEYAKNGGAQQK